jgi:hypothetical protein
MSSVIVNYHALHGHIRNLSGCPIDDGMPVDYCTTKTFKLISHIYGMRAEDMSCLTISLVPKTNVEMVCR